MSAYTKYVTSKILVSASTLFAVITFNFFLFRLAGDPKADLMRRRITQEVRERLIEQRGLDQDVMTQYILYLKNLLHGDLGTSFSSNKTVFSELMTALPNTMILAGVANLLAALIGTWIGIVAASRRRTKTDTSITQGSLIFYSMPEYWLGMILIGVFAVELRWFPTGHKADPGTTLEGVAYFLNVAHHAVLPVTSLTLGLLGMYSIIMRASVLEVIDEAFVTTARAIGLPPHKVIWRAARNALLPVATLAALNMGFIVAGAVTVEAIFSWPGLGDLTFDAIQTKDFPIMQGVFLLLALLVIVFNLIMDLSAPLLDPRIRSK